MSSRAKAVKIEPGQKVARKLAEGETHPFRIEVKAGEYFRVVAEQRGVDLELQLFAPGGEEVTKVDSPTGTRGFERVSEIAAVAGEYRVEVVGTEGTSPGEYEIHYVERRAAKDVTEADRKRVAGERVFQEGEGLRRNKKPAEAIAKYEQALGLWREGGERVGEADALHRIGWMQELLDRWEEAADFSGQAAEAYRAIGNSTGEAESLNRRGRILSWQGYYQGAETSIEQALRLFRATGHDSGEAAALNNLGAAHQWMGRFQEAVDAYEQALAIHRRLGNRSRESLALANLGDLYLLHGKWPEARDRFENALRIAEEAGELERAAVAQESLGALANREGQFEEARNRLTLALELYRKVGDRRGQAIALNSLGTALLKAGDPEAARARHGEALALFRELGDIQGEATALSNLGRDAYTQKDFKRALVQYRASLALFKRLDDRAGIALIHYGQGQALARLGDLDEALRELEKCMELVESLRLGSESLDLRAFYFASKQHYWDLYIDILMTLDLQRPRKGFAQRALEISERRRTRSLLDAMGEVRGRLREKVDPALLRKEREILDRLNQVERRRVAGPQGGDAEGTETIEREIREHLAQLDRVRAQMRQSTPDLAAFEAPVSLSADKIQKLIPDGKTLLLVYSLGEERSFLWRVTGKSLESHVLPGRERIESAARLVHDLLSRRQRRTESRLRRNALQDLSNMVLAPVADDLAAFQRLVIVADGALQLVPFAALPDPSLDPVNANGERPLLVEGHEIAYLPSVSVSADLRRRRGLSSPLREPGPLVAIVADPVFEADDPRVRSLGGAKDPASGGADKELEHSTRDLGLARLERLPHSRREAEEIRRLLRPGEVLPAFDFAASRELLDDERWRKAPILHFATHSLINDRQPELSGLVFSRVGPDGAPRPNGFLRLYDIYGLDLETDLVILSACQTGVGRELRGEGLLGLTRGFMAAGVPQVIVSLWKVEDRATAELMIRFYSELLDGRRPPEALQRAQLSMRKEPAWRDPFYWAGFIFLGDFEMQPGGGIEASDDGGVMPSRRAENDMPPPKAKPRPKPKAPPRPPTASGREVPPHPDPPVPVGGELSNSFELSSWAPAEIGPEAWNTLLAYCFRAEVSQRAAEDSARRLGASGDRFVQATASTARSLVPGSEVVIVPELAGCRFNPPHASLFWLEDWHCAEFRFQAVWGQPGFALESDLPGRISFYVGSVLVGDIPFEVKLTSDPQRRPGSGSFRRRDSSPYQSVFISYSRSDSVIVEALELAYGALGVRPLRDINFLRPGEKWQPEILKKIEESDIFQLFWSRKAKRSKPVQSEWQHALELRRPFFIRPVYWELPMPRPPKELAALDFHYLRLGR